MSVGSIVDFQVKIKPSEQLVDFIKSLDGIDDMSENVMKICGQKKNVIKEIKPNHLTSDETKFLKNLKLTETDFESAIKSLQIEEDSVDDEVLQTVLNLTDLRFINSILIKKRDNSEKVPFLNELLLNSKIILPKNEIIPRDPQLEARCQKLREEQENRTYRNMTKDVDAVRKHMPEDTLAYQMKSMNSQIIAVAQFIFSVIAGFAFGFIGVELIIGGLEFGFRLLLGIICALTIALAEIYFLAKKLNEIDDSVNFEKHYSPKRTVPAHSGAEVLTTKKPHEE